MDPSATTQVSSPRTGTGQPAGSSRGGPPRGGFARQAATFVGFCLVLFAARSSVADHYFVPTGSMIPTVAIGDRVLVNKLAYGLRVPFSERAVVEFGDPKRGDVVVLASPEDDRTLLKRVVAVPGDEVVVEGGRLSINGTEVPVDDVASGLVERLDHIVHPVRLSQGGGENFGPLRLRSGEFLVLGDNRGESRDGRAFGPVKRSAILGQVRSVWMRDGRPCWRTL
ncbi:MAG TPA: signal peptidase I [Polyangia bacterium]